MKVFVETSSALPLVSVVVGFASGATNDPVGKEGLARLTARMLRRGAQGISAEDIETRIDVLGAELSADASYSASSVQFELIRRNLDPVGDLVARILATPAFDGEELGKLVRETKAEIVESRDSDRTLAGRALRRTLFKGHPYARRVSGLLSTVDSITPEDLRAFYATHYVRENALVSVSGDIAEDEARRFVERVLAGLPAGERRADPASEPAPIRGRTLVFVDKPERTQTQMGIGSLGTSPHDADHMPWVVSNTAFGGTFTSRLMEEVRAKRGWSYGASSRVGFDRRREAFSMWTAPAAKDAAPCLELELSLLADVRKNGIREDELSFVKNYLRRSHAFDVDTPRKRVSQPLDEALFDLPSGYYAGYLDAVDRVTLGQANAALAERMPAEDLVVAVVGTAGNKLEDELKKALGEDTKVEIVPHDLE